MKNKTLKKIVVGISGSSAPILGIRLLEVLKENPQVQTHLVMSPTVAKTITYEAPDYNLEQVQALADVFYPVKNLAAAIASGSFATDGMVVIPCSMRSLGAIANGLGDNLLTRAADVTLKERRPLIVVPRETPLNLAHLRNMVAISEMGGVILPPVMAFYHQPKTPQDLINHTVGKVLDVLKIPHDCFRPWENHDA